MKISKERLTRLKEAGLLISEPFVETHIAYPGGYIIGKPKSVGGNFRENHESYWGWEQILCDAPASYLYEKNDKYFFVVHQWIPGPGWGDFEKTYNELEEALEAIIDYYFGDPITMNPPPLPPILSKDGKFCAKCGSEVLIVNSSVAWEKTKEFLYSSNISNKEEIIRLGYLPAGGYCHLCGKLYEEPCCAIARQIYEVYLLSLGLERKKVIVKLHQILNISLLEAKNIINSDNKLIFTSNRFEDDKKVEFICEGLTRVGAKIKLRVLTEKFGSGIDPYEIEEFTDF